MWKTQDLVNLTIQVHTEVWIVNFLTTQHAKHRHSRHSVMTTTTAIAQCCHLSFIINIPSDLSQCLEVIGLHSAHVDCQQQGLNWPGAQLLTYDLCSTTCSRNSTTSKQGSGTSYSCLLNLMASAHRVSIDFIAWCILLSSSKRYALHASFLAHLLGACLALMFRGTNPRRSPILVATG